MKAFKCCLGCRHRCENCHSTCHAYKRERTINKLLQLQRKRKDNSDRESRSYERQRSQKIEKAMKHKYKK